MTTGQWDVARRQLAHVGVGGTPLKDVVKYRVKMYQRMLKNVTRSLEEARQSLSVPLQVYTEGGGAHPLVLTISRPHPHHLSSSPSLVLARPQSAATCRRRTWA